MDTVPNEPLQERLGPESILVPKDPARAFGRGLRQKISSQLDAITSSVPMLEDEKYDEKYIEKINKIKENFARITNILNGLEKAKEVRLIKLNIGYDFKFSEETEDLGFNEGEILMGEDITTEFISALNHTIRNPLGIVMGRAESIESEAAKRIVSASNEIEEKISEITRPSPHDPQDIKMTTDIEGNTTITPLYPFS